MIHFLIAWLNCASPYPFESRRQRAGRLLAFWLPPLLGLAAGVWLWLKLRGG